MLVAVVLVLAACSVRVLREYERAVVFRLGRLLGEKGPGLVLLIPAIDRMVRVDLRTVTLDIPPQNLITRDNVPAKVNAVCYFRVIDASRVRGRRREATCAPRRRSRRRRCARCSARPTSTCCSPSASSSTRRSSTSSTSTPTRGGSRSPRSRSRTSRSRRRCSARWRCGAQAERERRAKIIHAEGEFQASKRLRDAADVISGNPAALQLRYMQTLTEIGATQNSTVVFPLPMDMIKPFLDASAALTRAEAPAELPADARAPLPLTTNGGG